MAASQNLPIVAMLLTFCGRALHPLGTSVILIPLIGT
jgi:hypothetical protein